MPEQVVFWKWIAPKMLSLVTLTSVYHWSIEGDSEPVKMFDRTANLANNQIINYRCDPMEKWLVLIGIAPSSPEKLQKQHNCIPDEHYVQTLFAMSDLEVELERRTVTYSLWNQSTTNMERKGWHPIMFSYANAGHQQIKKIKRFGTVEEDAYRKDLTINSLFYNINTSSVEDFTGRGIADLKSAKIVTPLSLKETFLDDPLRVLRAIRFVKTYAKRNAEAVTVMVTVLVTKEGRRLEAALGRSMEKAVKAKTDVLWARFQEENAKQEKLVRERTQQIPSLITNCLNKDLPAMLAKTVKKELAAVGLVVARTISPAIEKTLSTAIPEAFQKRVGDKAVNQLEKSVISKLEATFARQFQAQFQTSGKQALQVISLIGASGFATAATATVTAIGIVVGSCR